MQIKASAIAPANPTREGYTFIGWDKEFSNVTEDLVDTITIQAVYKADEQASAPAVYTNLANPAQKL